MLRTVRHSEQFLYMWLDSSNSCYDYYISPSKAKIINECLLNLKPPDNFRIHAFSLFERAHWKAFEYRSWLLYYLLPYFTGWLLCFIACSIYVLLKCYYCRESKIFQERRQCILWITAYFILSACILSYYAYINSFTSMCCTMGTVVGIFRVWAWKLSQ